VPKAALKLLSRNAEIFKEHLIKNYEPVCDTLIELIGAKNPSLRENGRECWESCLVQLAEALSKDVTLASCFEYVLNLLEKALKSTEETYFLPGTVRAVGIFSSAIIKYKGELYLSEMLARLIELSEKFIFVEREDIEDFKGLLIRQKQLASFIVSYSNISRAIPHLSENILFHFSKVTLEVFKHNSVIFKKYWPIMYNSVAQLFSALHVNQPEFPQWIRVFVTSAMNELLRITDEMIVMGDTESRIEAAYKLLKGIIKQETLGENLQQIILDEIARYYHQIFIHYDLRYSEETDDLGNTRMKADNPYDQQMFLQAVSFADKFFPSHASKIIAWIMPLSTAVIQKATDLPRLDSLYQFFKVIMKVSNDSNYFAQEPYARNYFLNAIKEIMLRMQEFSDSLLVSCLEACLSVPSVLVYSQDGNNLGLWLPALHKALEIGLSRVPLSYLAINTLQEWIRDLPRSVIDPVLPTILPTLSSYIKLEKQENILIADPEISLENKRKRGITYKAVRLLGSLGGQAHGIVAKYSHLTQAAWDTEPRLPLALPLNRNKLDIFLDPILTRLIDIAEHSSDRNLRLLSCELIHSIVIYTIGRNAISAGRRDNTIPYAKLYEKLFPLIYKLATDIETFPRQLFEPLSRQLVRWFAKSRSYEHPETMALLDCLMESASSSTNASLRTFGSSCLGEFARCVINNRSDPDSTFKSIIRRIESYANHPDTHKRMGAVLCLRSILPTMSNIHSLITKFILEVGHVLIMTIKLSHYDKKSKESEDVYVQTMREYGSILAGYIDILMNDDGKRAYHKNIHEFSDWIWEHCARPETLCRYEAQRLWKVIQVNCGANAREIALRLAGEASFGTGNVKEIQEFEGKIQLINWLTESVIQKQDWIQHRYYHQYNAQIQNFITISDIQEAIKVARLHALYEVLLYANNFSTELIPTLLLLTIQCDSESQGLLTQVETIESDSIFLKVKSITFELLSSKYAEIPSVRLSSYFDISILRGTERTFKHSLEGLKTITELLSSRGALPSDLNVVSQRLEVFLLDLLKEGSQLSQRKARYILSYFMSHPLNDATFLELLTNSRMFQNISDSILCYIARYWNIASECIFENLAISADALLPLLVPILQRNALAVKQKELTLESFVNDFIKGALRTVPALAGLRIGSYALEIVKIYCVFLEYCQTLSIFNEGLEILQKSTTFLNHLYELVRIYLSPDRNIETKKEALNLVGMIWSLKSPYGDLYKNLIPVLNEIQNQYFPVSTLNLIPSRHTFDFEALLRGYLNLVITTGHIESVKLLYRILREKPCGYEQDLNNTLQCYISQTLGAASSTEIFEAYSGFYNDFMNSRLDVNTGSNVRWGIGERLLLPILNNCDIGTLEDIMVSTSNHLVNRLNERFNNLSDPREYYLMLKEKAYILCIFERFYARLPTNQLKESAHKRIYGENAQGNELTKQLITFTNKYRKEKPEKFEMLGAVDWGQDALRNFSAACFACLCTVIRTTQSQEKIFTTFIFKDQVWKFLIQDVESYDFKPETNFKLLKPVEPKKEESVSSFSVANQYITSSLFSQSQDFSFPKLKPPRLLSKPEEPSIAEPTLELDVINSHISMQPLVSLLDRMEILFKGTWFEMPQWMQILHADLSNPTHSLSVKIFIIKLILNRPRVFERWGIEWFEPIVSVICSPKNGGVGFHYFLRDICTLFLYDWENFYPNTKERQATHFLNHLIKVGADTRKNIFSSNYEIISKICEKWRSLVIIEHKYIEGMIKRQAKPGEDKEAVAWRLNGILVYGLAIHHNIKILEALQEKPEVLDNLLLKCLEFPRRQIVMAAAEVIGRRLSVSESEEVLNGVLPYLMKRESKDIAAVVSILEKLTVSYPQILSQNSVALRVSTFFATLSGVTRASLLKAVHGYVEYIKKSQDFGNLPELAEYLHRDKDKISADYEDSHTKSLLELLVSLADIHYQPSVQKVLSGFIRHLPSYSSHKDTEIRKQLYLFMQKMYDQAIHMQNPGEIRAYARTVLVHGLADTDLSTEITEFWHNENRLSLNPTQRAIQLLNELYTPEEEQLWMLASSHLLLKLCELSTDYTRLLFDTGLGDCEFHDIEVSSGRNASLPMTPVFSMSYYQQDLEGRSGSDRSSQSSLYTHSSLQSSQFSEFAVPRIPNRIRHLPEGSLSSQDDRRQKLRQKQLERVQQRAREQRQKNFTAVRKYRVGDLPDIQILHRDLLLPIINICRLDSEISTHCFVALFTSLFKDENEEIQRNMAQGLQNIMERSRFSPSVIACIHRSASQMVKISGNIVNIFSPKTISRSAIKSFAFQSGIVLLQECILHQEPSRMVKRRKIMNESTANSGESIALWLALVKVYEKMGDLDTVQGLWMQIIANNPHPSLNRVRLALDMKLRGNISDAAQEMRNILNEVTDMNSSIQSEVKKQYQESLSYLGNWQELENSIESKNSPIYLKTLLRQDRFTDLADWASSVQPHILYSQFPYEMTLLSIAQDDNDRARYYLDEAYTRFIENWQGLYSLSVSARHKLIQNVQRYLECTEYLKASQQGKDETIDDFMQRFQSYLDTWRSRKPSLFYDDLNVWDNILYARVLFYDRIVNKYRIEVVKEFPALSYSNAAELPIKSGFYDVAEIYLRKAVNRRGRRDDIRIYGPVLKLNSKRISGNVEAYSTNELIREYNKLLDAAIHQNINPDQTHLNILLQGSITKKLVTHLLYRNDPDIIQPLSHYIKLTYDHLKHSLEHADTSESQLKFAHFCDMVLREYESSEEKEALMGVCFNRAALQPEILARSLVTCSLNCMASGNIRAHDQFPRLLELLLKYPVTTSQPFRSNIDRVPAWMFIRWISQLLSIIDKEESSILKSSLERCIRTYPQTFYYPYRCFTSIESAYQFERLSNASTEVYRMIEDIYKEYSYLDSFVQALDCLTHPEHRYRYWYDGLKEALEEPQTNVEFVEYWVKEMFDNLINVRNNLLNGKVGTYNKKFADNWRALFNQALGKDGSKVIDYNGQRFAKVMEEIHKKIISTQLSHGNEKLNTYSEWLADYDITDHTSETIDIPGQISGLHEPLSSTVKIVSFSQNLLILSSIRRPKRLGIHGSDEKEYYVLVKGGEDLRLDERIQQLFSVMNKIFSQDPDCARLQLTLKTFQVVPMNKRLGILEWVSNTEPLRSLINRELNRHHRLRDLNDLDAMKQRQSWLSSIASNSSGSRISEQHIFLLGHQPEAVIKSFEEHESMVPWDLLRQGLIALSTSPESYLNIRQNFINTLAAISICGYILGIGDRHLENFLVDRNDGGLLAIDFGISFGSGVGLGVPELIPFRLTRQLRSVLSPEGVNGQLRQIMVHCLKALRKHKNLILDCSEVFINEPLLDWVKAARNKENLQVTGSLSSFASLTQGELSWFPKSKILTMKRKLEGWNSASVMLEEIRETKHSRSVIFT
jgi:hypothetical protein